jgi:hypothetical protein
MVKHARTAVVSLAILACGVGIVLASGLLRLPTVPVTVNHGPWQGGAQSTLDITLSGVPAGYDVSDGTYPGWCLENNLADDPDDGSIVPLMDTTDPSSFVDPCESYASIPWDKVNYVLNHKVGEFFDVQLALWVVAGTNYWGMEPTAAAWTMINDAEANGTGFVPQAGAVAAAALCFDGLSGGVDPDGVQDTIIEVERILIFGDGFESGDVSAWSSFVP